MTGITFSSLSRQEAQSLSRSCSRFTNHVRRRYTLAPGGQNGRPGPAGGFFGLAAALIPGFGPFISAGALAAWLGATGGAAAAGAIVGGTTGAVAGALSKWGLDQHDAQYYGDAIERGAVFVAAELDGT